MKQTPARIAIALLAFILGTIAHTLWSHFTTPESSLPSVNVGRLQLSEPATTSMAVAMPVATPDTGLIFGGGLRLVTNEVQLTNEFLRYKVDVTYPQIEGSNSPRIRNLNRHIERLVTNEYQWLLNPSREDLRYYKQGPHPEVFNSLNLYYEVILATDSFLSIYFEGFSYGIGAAHSVQFSFVVNYDFTAQREIKLSDIFQPGSKYLDVVSNLCVEKLSKTEYGGSLWIRELAPVGRNFESWNMTRDGIRFSFDACKLFGCSAGKQTVEIPFTALKHTRRNYGN